MADLILALSIIPPRVWWVIGAVLCIVFICWGLHQRIQMNEPECRGCKYNNMGECDCPVLCERGEMWEAMGDDK